jgi:hypothetical protein
VTDELLNVIGCQHRPHVRLALRSVQARSHGACHVDNLCRGQRLACLRLVLCQRLSPLDGIACEPDSTLVDGSAGVLEDPVYRRWGCQRELATGRQRLRCGSPRRARRQKACARWRAICTVPWVGFARLEGRKVCVERVKVATVVSDRSVQGDDRLRCCDPHPDPSAGRFLERCLGIRADPDLTDARSRVVT